MVELNYSPAMQRFAAEIRSFVRAELPSSTKEKVLHRERVTVGEQVQWQRKLCSKGWACPGWPRKYGGPGWDAMQRHVYDCVTAEEGAPPAIPFGESMIAPVLFEVGSREQRAQILPRIRTLEYIFCQGFSEPGAGSDLASLRTRAELDGDQWVINGQKAWTSFAHKANMIFMLVRTALTEKPQDGISMMVFPLSTPGITIRPVITMDGGHSFNETFLDDVRVPHSSIIGDVNKGWTYAKLLLGHERTSIARIGQSKRELVRLKVLAADKDSNDTPLIDDAVFRSRIAEIEIDLLALEVAALRLVSGNATDSHGAEANMLKIRGSEIQQRLTELQMDALGPYALLYDPSRGLNDTNFAPIGPVGAAAIAPTFLSTRGVTIYGGSNEIQKNIIAKSLGL